MTRILGLDPGTAITGYGIVEPRGDGAYRAVAYGALRTAAQQPLPRRLLSLYDQLRQVVAEYQPQAVAVEKLFVQRNLRSALSVGQARGVLLLVAAQEGLPVAEYTPTEVKLALTGYGAADKQQMQRMVQLLLGLTERPRPDDVADALAVALCHGQHMAWTAHFPAGGQAA
ncbi:MAG: crossover junction endodeoxyribonuclease RuvC [Chloroflexi bacterium]|nr:crossover junction endodeoxyribonuclease RuvC [Chloroflexota bacterium]